MQNPSPKAQAELLLFQYCNGKDIDVPLEDVIKDIARPLTALEKIDIDKRTNTSCPLKNEKQIASLLGSISGQKYVSSFLGSLQQHELHGLMIFAGFGRKDSKTPLDQLPEATQQKLFYALRKITDFVSRLRKHSLFTLDKFTQHWDGAATRTTSKPMSDLERQQELMKLSAHAGRMSMANQDPDGLKKNKVRELEIREAWAEMENQLQTILNNPETRVNELQSAKNTAIQHLKNWQAEALHIYAMELIPLLESRSEELEKSA